MPSIPRGPNPASKERRKYQRTEPLMAFFSHTPPPRAFPGEDPEHFKLLVIKLQIELAPGTAVEEALVAASSLPNFVFTRIAKWVTDLTAEALTAEDITAEGITADPTAVPSRLMKMFSKNRRPLRSSGSAAPPRGRQSAPVAQRPQGTPHLQGDPQPRRRRTERHCLELHRSLGRVHKGILRAPWSAP